jgi:hypothetical protein
MQFIRPIEPSHWIHPIMWCIQFIHAVHSIIESIHSSNPSYPTHTSTHHIPFCPYLLSILSLPSINSIPSLHLCHPVHSFKEIHPFNPSHYSSHNMFLSLSIPSYASHSIPSVLPIHPNQIQSYILPQPIYPMAPVNHIHPFHLMHPPVHPIQYI